ncbi:MAG: ABC transporter ATP-binding protein [Blautia sp.]|nr:ABC transporter ATP-binding protein [Lachnoclostridium sp.]MCM1212086.1 ABC transporter ATP-binding protein [Blautia sp.]
MNTIIMKTVDLCKSFANNGGQNHVLDMINLEIYEGDFTVIMGSSGAGKSTLLYALSGMDKPTGGEVHYKGRMISRLKEKEMASLRAGEFGFVFQQAHLVSNLTLLENVAVTGYLRKKRSGKEVLERAGELLARMNVGGAAERLPFQVSGGEAQRAAIARAMMNEPGMIFADEPTGALNKHNTQEVLNLLSGLHDKGQSILMVTHDMKAAIRATRLLYLEDGKVIGEMSMPPYRSEDAKNREKQVNAWLTSMEW